ncbi:MAG: hypothetical protein KY443_01330 [Actinobacteria bacterium]|nr:hypothetical protein [Actinomycetota bacterium]
MKAWRALGATAIAVAWAGGLLVPAHADAPGETGWWWAGRPSAAVPALLQPVPAPPEGGLYVAGGPNGPSGVSALRFRLPLGATASTLTVVVAEVAGTPVVDACPVITAWHAGANGGWDARPSYFCDINRVKGTYDAALKTITFDVSALVDSTGALDVALLGGLDPATRKPAAFSAAFEAPDERTLVVIPPEDETDDDDGDDDDGAVFEPPPQSGSGGFPESWPSFSTPYGVVSVSTTTTTVVPARQATAAPTRTRPIARGIGTDGFAYPAVLALPLGLLVLGSYLLSSMTRPIRVTVGARR